MTAKMPATKNRKNSSVRTPPNGALSTAPNATPTKQSQLVDLLKRDTGASIAELVTALGWQAHTTRAALTGLRKKGHAIAKSKVRDETRYSLDPVAAA